MLRLPCQALLIAALATLAPSEFQAVQEAKAVLPDPAFHFGKVVRGTVVEHGFTLRNGGQGLLEVYQASMNAPLVATRLPRQVQPGSQAILRFRLDTSTLEGPFDGQIYLSLNDSALPVARLAFEGQVVAGVEVSPMPAVFLVAQRGQRKTASVDLISHEPEPLRILQVKGSSERLRASLETLVEGRRYRLTLTLFAEGPAGKLSERIYLRTSSKTTPVLTISANTYVREKVYTFPDSVDVGTLRLRDIDANPGLLERAVQTLMVYQVGGSDFKVNVSTDVPALELKAVRGSDGDRWQVTVGLIKERIHPGPIRGALLIQTNDPQFGRLTVPVSGSILAAPDSPAPE